MEQEQTLKRRINNNMASLLGKVAPKDIPQELFNEFTMNGEIPIKRLYFNEVGLPFFPRIYTKKMVSKDLNLIKEQIKNSKDERWINCEQYGWLRDALKKYPISGKTVVNMGSGSTYYESVALFFGASKVFIIEYNPIISLHPNIKAFTPKKYEKSGLDFDAGFSISSFEHDGLGRYGDPINPNADLETMKKMKRVIKKNGLLFLSVPIGKDCLIWNANRIYGKKRRPLLLKDWEILDIFGYDKKRAEKANDSINGEDYMPVYVLKNI